MPPTKPATAKRTAPAKAAPEATPADKRAAAPADVLELAERYHAEGCPEPDRLEKYSGRRPARPEQGEAARDVTVIRCITCGGHRVQED